MDEAERASLAAEAGRRSLASFCELVDPTWHPEWFHEEIASKLERALADALAGKKARVILAMPPRHGKSRLASVLFPAWALGRHPGVEFILSTYGAELSEKLGRDTRDVVASDRYRAIFPGALLREDQKAKAKWMTAQGGSYTGVGVGGAVTGTGADVIVVDDPHKSREEAESETVRETVWDYYRSTLYTRLEGAGAVVVIMQRWHTDDLVGRLLEEDERRRAAGEEPEGWEVINFPAIAEEADARRQEGEPLWPSKFPVGVLENIRRTVGVYNWAGQYQQTPISSETQEFKPHLFRTFEEDDLRGRYVRHYTFVDPAISQKKDADRTVVLTVAKEVNGPNVYRLREDAGRFTPAQAVDLIFAHQAEFPKTDVHIEAVAYQQALRYAVVEEQRRRQTYFPVHELKPRGDKVQRIRGLLPLYQAGVIFHRPGDAEYERELLSFPMGKHDDRADCMSFMLLAAENTRSLGPTVSRTKFRGYFSR